MPEHEFESKVAINKRMIEAYTKLEEGYTILSEIPLLSDNSRNKLQQEANVFSKFKAEYEKLLVDLILMKPTNNDNGE